MTRVLLICSVHRETGRATASELLWLLERLRPEALFLEHSATRFSTFLDGSCGTLESAAVLAYRSRFPVNLVPVDLPPPSADFKPKVDALFDRVEEASPEFIHLSIQNRYHTGVGGFAYLNSPSCAALQSAMQTEMRITVERLGDPVVGELYRLWTQANHLREAAMLEEIEAFAQHAPFATGALLVGAAHIPTLFQKVRSRQADESSAISWDFDWVLDPQT